MKKVTVLAVILSLILFQSAVATDGDGFVESYVTSPYGEVYKNSYDECWRSRFADTTEKLEECGYEPEPVVTQEIVVTDTAGTITTTINNVINIRAALLFAFDSDILSNDAKAVIDERTAKYRDRGKLTSNVEVVGHTDSTGSASYNQGLSERRARAVADYLTQNTNITSEKIDAVGRGETDPIASNNTKEGRAENRRVTIVLNGEVTE